MRETGREGFHAKVRKKLNVEFPECEVHKLDPIDKQGSPDLLLICPITWATLEVKKSSKAPKQPNQDYYVEKHDKMSFSSFIFPENENEVMAKLHNHVNQFKNGDKKK